MSIIIIAFPGAPKVSNEAIKKENELNEQLKKNVSGEWRANRGMLKGGPLQKVPNSLADIVKESNNEIDFAALFQKMTEENFDSLPRGGGIYSK